MKAKIGKWAEKPFDLIKAFNKIEKVDRENPLLPR
jgi:hypothetical protein